MNTLHEKYIFPEDESEESSSVLAEKVVASSPQPAPTTPSDVRPSGSYAPWIVLSLMMVGLVFLVGRGFARNTPPSTPTVVAPIAAVVPPTATAIPPTPTPNCVSVKDTYLKTILELEARTKYNAASENAALALSTSGLCKEEQEVIALKLVNDGLEALFAEPFDSTRAGQEHFTTRYQEIQAQAKRYGAPLPRSLAVAQRAAQSGKYTLATFAYESAWEEQTFTSADRAFIQDYVSNLYNAGKYFSESLDGETRTLGLRFLSTSYHVSERHRIGDGFAWDRLRTLCGTDERSWPEPLKTPLL